MARKQGGGSTVAGGRSWQGVWPAKKPGPRFDATSLVDTWTRPTLPTADTPTPPLPRISLLMTAALEPLRIRTPSPETPVTSAPLTSALLPASMWMPTPPPDTTTFRSRTSMELKT